MRTPSLVTVGLPVFNGSGYLELALTSLLQQDYPRLEVVISDNGSTDDTRAICERYAAKDSRIRYYRSDINRGAAWNFNNVVQLAAGEYFMWAAHDDLWAPGCISRYTRALDDDPQAVLVYCRAQPIDSRGNPVGQPYSAFSNDASDTRTRWQRLLQHWELHAAIYGMMRMGALRRTRLVQTCAACEIILMSELALQGKTLEVPETLSWKRIPDAGERYRTTEEQIAYLDPRVRAKGKARFLRLRAMLRCVSGLRRLGTNSRAMTYDAMRIYVTRYLAIDLKEGISRGMRNQPALLASLRRAFHRATGRTAVGG